MHRYIPGAACWWPMAPKPPVHRRSSARCTSRRWRLLVYTGRGGHPGGAAPGGRTAAVRQYHHQPLDGGEFEGGEGGNSEKLFTIKEDEDVLVTMLVWIEGTDDDCTNSIQMDEIIGNIQFISRDAQAAVR